MPPVRLSQQSSSDRRATAQATAQELEERVLDAINQEGCVVRAHAWARSPQRTSPSRLPSRLTWHGTRQVNMSSWDMGNHQALVLASAIGGVRECSPPLLPSPLLPSPLSALRVLSSSARALSPETA